jgi:hypothetical protein
MHTLFENEGGLTDRAISERAKAKGEELGRNDYPALRTVNKYHREYPGLSEHIRKGYRHFRWPDAMEAGLLPWESSAAVLELLAWSEEHGLPRPPVAIARWYWRMVQALPKATLGVRLRVAITVATHQEAGRLLPERYDQTLARNNNPRMKVCTGGPSASWAVHFVVNNAAKAALYEEEAINGNT